MAIYLRTEVRINRQRKNGQKEEPSSVLGVDELHENESAFLRSGRRSQAVLHRQYLRVNKMLSSLFCRAAAPAALLRGYTGVFGWKRYSELFVSVSFNELTPRQALLDFLMLEMKNQGCLPVVKPCIIKASSRI